MKSKAQTRLTLLSLIAISTALVLTKNFLVLGAVSGTIIAVFGAKTGFGKAKSRLSAVAGISLLVILFQVILNTSLSFENRVFVGTMTALRLVSLSLLVLLFTETTSPSAIVSALSFLPRKLCLVLTMSFSLIPAIIQELSNIRLAQAARGFQPKGMNLFRSIVPILIPLLNRTLTRAEHIAMVLETRGFEG